jgi:hypothetical protein
VEGTGEGGKKEKDRERTSSGVSSDKNTISIRGVTPSPKLNYFLKTLSPNTLEHMNWLVRTTKSTAVSHRKNAHNITLYKV